MDLSILIPAKNEEFLTKTVEDILSNAEGKTEVIVVLDGYDIELPTLPNDPRVRIIHNPESKGQRAATNQACTLSEAKYIMKCDAHCAFDTGFDRKMIEAFKRTGDNVTMVPIMRNLHAFNWVCPDGHNRYQGPSGLCKECDKPTVKDVVWIAKTNPQSTSYCFDQEPHFQYFNDFKKRPERKKDLEETGLTESMSLQGSCFMMTRDKYWELNICDESLGSWGSQGIEVACKTWLSGGRVVVNHTTWYAHMFRTQGGDFGFPYHNPGNKVQHAKQTVRGLFFDNKWEKQIHPLSWLVEKFWPVPGWSEDARAKLKAWSLQHKSEKTKGIIFYTNNRLNLKIAHAVQRNLNNISKEKGIPIVSTSLKPMPHFGNNIHLSLESGYLTMFKQILAALEASTTDIIFFAEHDVLYSKTHFDFTPSDKDTFYYNTNVYKLRNDGMALWVDDCRQASGICVYRETALNHYRERVEYVEKYGYDRTMGFEPGTHGRIEWKHPYKSESWVSKYSNVDIRHDGNLTPTRWSKDQYRNAKSIIGWKFVEELPGWGKTVGRFDEFIKDVRNGRVDV